MISRLLTLSCLFFISPALAQQPPSQFQKDSAVFQSRCAKCHTIGRGDRVGPDLKGVGQRRDKEWLVGFLTKTDWYLANDPEAKKLLEKFNGVRMENMGLSAAEAEGLLGYIEAAGKGPAAPEEEPEARIDDPALRVPTPNEGRSLHFTGIASALFFLTLAATVWTLGLRIPAAFLLIVALAAAYWSVGGRRYHRLLGDQQGYAPEQPIAFSHELHAGKLQIDCMACHHGATSSDVAGVPAVSTCMNCHTAIRKVAGAKEPSPEIEKLVAAWETRLSSAPRPVEWNKVHDLPDFSHFSHRVHVANNIKCQECHGKVQEMPRLRQSASLSMGWCLDCHRKEKSQAPTHWKRTGGPQDCAACHW